MGNQVKTHYFFADRRANNMNPAYETIATLLEYPEPKWFSGLERFNAVVENENSEYRSNFCEFRSKVESLSVVALQELYTQTFDLNPVCTLEVGYHLFGENYKRGIFLANLRETESPFELGQDRQLPDYLPVLLRLLERLEPSEIRHDLIVECLLPALHKMIDALEKAKNPYGYLLKILRSFLHLEIQPGVAPEGEEGNERRSYV